MTTLKIRVSGVKTKVVSATLDAGESGEMEISFSQEWRKRRKAAVFRVYGEETAEPVIKDKCSIPESAASARHFYIYIIGEDDAGRVITERAEVRRR